MCRVSFYTEYILFIRFYNNKSIVLVPLIDLYSLKTYHIYQTANLIAKPLYKYLIIYYAFYSLKWMTQNKM